MLLRSTKFCLDLSKSYRLNYTLLKPSAGISISEGYGIFVTFGIIVLGLSFLFVFIRGKYYRDLVIYKEICNVYI